MLKPMKKNIKKGLKKVGVKIEKIQDEKKQFLLEYPEFELLEKLPVLIGSKTIIKTFRQAFNNFNISNHKNGFLVCFSDFKIYVESAEEFFILNEIFIEKDYLFNAPNKYVIIDIGANIGLASLFFSSLEVVDKIYAFEPVKETYNQAKYNFSLNTTKVIEFNNYGLGSSEREETFLFDSKVKGNTGVRKDLSSRYANNLEAKNIVVTIKNSSKEVKRIVDSNNHANFLVKMDCEGAEYEIFENLSASNILSKINGFIIEWHDKGVEPIMKILKENNFIIFSKGLSPISGMLYAYKI